MFSYFFGGALSLSFAVCSTFGYLAISGVHLVSSGVINCADRMAEQVKIPELKI